MKIINKTNNAILAEKAILADTPLSRLKGLLGRKQLNIGEGIILRPCSSIHTFFMHFPIDILFLDKNNKIIKAIPDLKPFHLTAIYFNAAFAIELPVGTISSTSTHIGDEVLYF
ncbi:MAG: DUF192 domain-containing protein [Candidatus Omnitrophica bacterium]|nr:DUF192 domain-containing protein [Candidatus Omnitrophota bacterium]